MLCNIPHVPSRKAGGVDSFCADTPLHSFFSICLAWVILAGSISPFTFNLARADGASRVPELWNPCESLRDLANSLLHTAGLQIKRASELVWSRMAFTQTCAMEFGEDTQIGGDIRGKLVAIYYREVRLQDIPETLATPEQERELEITRTCSYILLYP